MTITGNTVQRDNKIVQQYVVNYIYSNVTAVRCPVFSTHTDKHCSQTLYRLRNGINFVVLQTVALKHHTLNNTINLLCNFNYI